MLILAFAIIAFVITVDQLSKYAVLSVIGIGGPPFAVIDSFFYIVCHRNSGAAWGILKDGRLFFLIITPVMLIPMLFFLIRSRDKLLRIALAFVIGGAIGNYIDRVSVGSVVDFLDFYILGYNFPTFNAADSSIVFGSALLAVFSLLYKKAEDEPAAADAPTDGGSSTDALSDDEPVADAPSSGCPAMAAPAGNGTDDEADM